MAANLRSTFLMSRESFHIMKEQRSGIIVSITSAAEKTVDCLLGHIIRRPKPGIIRFTKSLAIKQC